MSKKLKKTGNQENILLLGLLRTTKFIYLNRKKTTYIKDLRLLNHYSRHERDSRDAIFNVQTKYDISQLNLTYGTNN